MSSDFLYADENIEIKPNTSKRNIKNFKRLIVIAMIIFAAEIIWLFGITPFIPFSTVEVQSFAGFERKDVLLLSGIDDNSSFFSTNVKEIQNILAGNILVESATVTKRFPDKLSIYLVPRSAIALALTNIGSKQIPIYVDRNGVFFKYAVAGLSETSPCPILSGFTDVQLNMNLPSALVPLCENLYQIAVSSPQLLAAISEIRIERNAWDNYDIVLYPVHSSIRVRLENNLSEDVLKYMLLILNVFEDRSVKPQEIDFRSGVGSYRVKEKSL